MGTEACGARRKKRQEASHSGSGSKAGGTTPSVVGKRRGVRTIAKKRFAPWHRVSLRTAELNRRVQVTATKSWGPTRTEKVRREDANQVAAPTETRTPTWHRANIAHKRVRMEGWRQRRLG